MIKQEGLCLLLFLQEQTHTHPPQEQVITHLTVTEQFLFDYMQLQPPQCRQSGVDCFLMLPMVTEFLNQT